MKAQQPRDIITVDQDVLGGCPVFKGTRVPVESLIWHLEKGATVDDFLEDFPTVTHEQASAVLELVGGLFSAEKIASSMKLLLDENLPKRLKQGLMPHEAYTVRDMGWNGKGNGALLALMKENGFHAMITFDKNLRYQQNFERYDLPVLVLNAVDNTYNSLAPLMPMVLQAINEGLRTGPTVISSD